MGILAPQCHRFFDSIQGFHSFSSFPPLLSVRSLAEGRRNRVNLLLYATLIWIWLCIVCYRKEHTHTHTHTLVATSLPYREATSAEIFSARIMALSCYLRPRFYRNLVEFQKLRHLTTPRPPFAVMHTLLDINVSR